MLLVSFTNSHPSDRGQEWAWPQQQAGVAKSILAIRCVSTRHHETFPSEVYEDCEKRPRSLRIAPFDAESE